MSLVTSHRAVSGHFRTSLPATLHRTTFRQALNSIHGADQARPHGISPPPRARDARTPTRHDSPGGAQVPFFEFLDDRGGANMQDARGVTNPAGIHSHINNLIFDALGLAGIGMVK